MARSLLGFDVKETEERPRGNGVFLWSVVLLLLTGLAITSWIGSFYIVAHPENPKCYGILKKLKQLKPPRHFPVTEGPFGKFLSPKMLLEQFGRMGPEVLARKNQELLRAYVKNYLETKDPVSYVAGNFEVISAYELEKGEFFPSGVVALTQAKDYPQVLVEMVFPAASTSAKTIRELLPAGREITLERSRDLAAVLHVQRMADSRLQFTVVPLSYGSFQLKDGRGSFTLKSPADLEEPTKGGGAEFAMNIAGNLPLIYGIRLQKGLAQHAEFRRKVFTGGDAEKSNVDALVAVRMPEKKSGPVEVATPVVIREAAPVPAPAPTPAPQRAANPVRPPVPAPAPTVLPPPPDAPLPDRFPLPPRPIVRATPAPVQADPPKPVVLSTPRPAAPPAKERRVFSTKEASALVDAPESATGMLLSGEFVVTGAIGQRVALRAREALRDREADPTVPGTSGAMIVVEFPAGQTPPAKDATIARDAQNGFVIRSVRRGQGGQIMILADDVGAR